MSVPVSVGIDVGATTIIAGLVAADGHVLGRDTVRLTVGTVASGLAKPLAELIETFRVKTTEPHDILGVGVGTAGLVRWPEGEVGFAANHGHRRLKLRDRLSERCGFPVIVDNDANVAALAEIASHPDEAVLFVAVGTGLGSGFVANGQIVRGHNGLGAELGHVVVDDSSPVECTCGRTGCLETLASGRALARMGQLEVTAEPHGTLAEFLTKRRVPVSMRSMIDAALAGVPAVEDMVKTMGEHIGTAIGQSAQGLLPVDRVVVGGGLSVLGDMLTMPIHRACRKALGRSKYMTVPLVSLSVHGGDTIMVGAGLLAHDQFGSVVSSKAPQLTPRST